MLPIHRYICFSPSGQLCSSICTTAAIFIKTAGINRLSVFAKRNLIHYLLHVINTCTWTS